MLQELLKSDELERLMNEGFIGVQWHPEADLRILNYTPKAQYERQWHPLTKACRGLIVDSDRNIHSRPFEKFFNLGEHDPSEIPNEPFEVFEKMDGSLGILYWVNDQPYIATRGSFKSDQAHKANKLLYSRYNIRALKELKRDRTYLFEIIYPENRIVVDYGAREQLVLLAVIDNETGKDLPLESDIFTCVQQWHGIKDVESLRELEEPNREGFVARFRSGFRVKVKFDEYCRLHRLITQVSNKVIWEYMRDGLDFDEILDRVPDEYYSWVQETRDELYQQYCSVEEQCRKDFKTFDTRKETALYFKKCKYPSILFGMLDDKPIKDRIWKLIEPEYQPPFA